MAALFRAWRRSAVVPAGALASTAVAYRPTQRTRHPRTTPTASAPATDHCPNGTPARATTHPGRPHTCEQLERAALTSSGRSVTTINAGAHTLRQSILAIDDAAVLLTVAETADR